MNKKIVIIGAGSSGLAAASRLLQNGINCENITILEAQNRIGGRIHTVINEGHPLELGAQWVHGVDGNAVYRLAASEELNTTIQTLQSSGLANDVTFAFKEKQLTKEQVEEFMYVIESIRQNSQTELPVWNQSLGDYFMEKFQENYNNGALSSIDRTTALALLEWYRLMENAIDGSDDWFETCGSGHLHYKECPGDPLVTWKRGYSSLFDILMRDVPKCNNGLQLPFSNRIFLNKAVCKIEWDRTTKIPNLSKAVKLHCEDGCSYEADYILVTCSLGCLKTDAQRMFIPPLPVQKTRVIEGIAFGTVNKIFLKFKKPWWDQQLWGGISLLRNPNTPGNKSLSDVWSDSILGFYTVRNQPNILVAWITGQAARTVENLPEEEILRSCSDLLKQYIEETSTYSEPIELIRSSWFTNPYTRGSYSYRSVKSKELNVWASDLAEPVYDSSGQPRLFFAGEATHDYFYSTVHGAVESGWREADRIAKYCNGLTVSRL